MDSKKTRFSADVSAVLASTTRITRQAVCGKYLAFAHRDLCGVRRLVELSVIGQAEPVARRWKLRQR
jgi:hypothetical protein